MPPTGVLPAAANPAAAAGAGDAGVTAQPGVASGQRAVAAAAASQAPAVPSTLAEEVRSAFDYMPTAFAGYVAGVTVVSSLFWAEAAPTLLVPWYAAFLLLFALRLALLLRFRHRLRRADTDWLHWRRLSNAGTVVTAAFWGATGWIFHPLGNALEQTGLIIVVYTFCVAAIPVLSVQPRLYALFAALCFVPMTVRIASAGDYDSWQLAAEIVAIIVLTTLFTRGYRQTLRRVMDLKLHADALLVQLRAETRAAEAARRDAEVANRAKTQFFTAASHDLRQPLHAMGLFAEALRQRAHEPEVAQLVNSINESVDALEGLFSELLDISRIDSGGVEVRPESFAFGDLLRKIRLHFEPSAFEKGLALRLRGGRTVVHADPLLVERIVRNLVSNAIRYTADGSVLVGCRRRGTRVLLQVWDTGPGIGADEQARVFEEFYQVPGTAVAAPHERKGLGLGLAIVKRLAGLMQAPLTLASRPGHGTVFTLELPAGLAPSRRDDRPSGKAPAGLTLDGRRIVVVEDEAAVRAGLEVLLAGWGATLLAFDSVDAARRWAAAAPAGEPAPDLLIVDYRLEAGATGVDARDLLRRRFGRGVPAIVVTGSTMSGHEREAHEHDFHLLIKPVVPNKLRAMIAFKLAARAAVPR